MALLALQLLLQIVGLALVMGVLIFWPAGTWRFWQGWWFLGAFFVPTLLLSFYFLVQNPEFLIRRMRWREPERAQAITHSVLFVLFVGGLVVAGLDHRFGWSHMPIALGIIGDVAILAGFIFIIFVFRMNPYAASTVEVEQEQQVISTGLYALVRHPMYLGALPIIYGIPLALGSYWALLAYLPFIPGLFVRLLNEEEVLHRDLPGYGAY
ncbi:MAG TPA: isoprenylcysteine carboxylmethyltransferase family protein, partial [Armatimonadota bacterium]